MLITHRDGSARILQVDARAALSLYARQYSAAW